MNPVGRASEEREFLIRLLKSREERAWVQTLLLRDAACVLQIAVNVPGAPKRLAGDELALRRTEERIGRAVSESWSSRVYLVNAAGPAVLLAFREIGPLSLKSRAVEIEEGETWCRVMDLDVVTGTGPVSRVALGFEPRRCLLCTENSKVCAREGRHEMSALRGRAAELLLLVR